jgi:hypothetical protein
MLRIITVSTVALLVAAACATTPDHCAFPIEKQLNTAMADVESRVNKGCQYQYDRYFQDLLAIAQANPDPSNKAAFSDHLMRVNSMGVISKRQAMELYNRYFNVKFVSFTGDYNTCAQACPSEAQVISNMKSELKDKELGLMQASSDASSYYRADHLFKETQLVLSATCRACAQGEQR